MFTKYIAVFVLTIALFAGVVGFVKAQSASPTATTTPTPRTTMTVTPTTMPAGAPATGFGTL